MGRSGALSLRVKNSAWIMSIQKTAILLSPNHSRSWKLFFGHTILSRIPLFRSSKRGELRRKPVDAEDLLLCLYVIGSRIPGYLLLSNGKHSHTLAGHLIK
ncbi:hypothetical protein, variant 3 [Blastomyces dermatitidis ATCC 18188]|uniref:Uncharacterized protein n=1 Tax=Ajellomyces dermatitidis (strain ATCC 18188 / CBS 674.68) TaxID=653446 RepID=F2T3Z0_AJEDA|nr:hypothetical protein BDDG_00586 [Blastomyces dermatitidis ATCC 18188]KMW66547.1 hypothetical protein, variant 1 [Blastomyces dermatitidis ATCC 18188]KMW66548.1 hypothetical protein, variant 2 [Blastomyces dermatitidis ATCC 18188]KMW66549.1 hypothetical protein, variant 3 [Blastomyces dermatitidis ATCC 18188]